MCRQKKGRQSLSDGRPSDRTSLPDWEESVPNPAPDLLSSDWLNEALMMGDGGGCGFRAIADAVGLQQIIERQAVRDALRTDPQGTRRQDVDLAVAKPSAAATILDLHAATRILDHLCAACLGAMFKAGEGCDVGNALSLRLASRSAADLPQAGLRLGECRRLLSRSQRQASAEAKGQNESRVASHGRAFTTEPLTERTADLPRPVRPAGSQSSTSRKRNRLGSRRRHRPSPRARPPESAQSPNARSQDRNGSRD